MLTSSGASDSVIFLERNDDYNYDKKLAILKCRTSYRAQLMLMVISVMLSRIIPISSLTTKGKYTGR